MPHPQPITGSIHHHRLPSREEGSALSGEVAARGPRILLPAPARGGCLLSPRSCRCVRTGKAGGGSAPYLPAGGRGARRVPVLVPTPGLGGREPRAESPPLVPARAPRRSPRIGAWSAGLWVGGALTSLGCPHSGLSGGHGAGSDALRSPCGPEPGRSFVFRGTQPQTRTPREGRGGVEAGAARGGETRGVGGAQSWRPRSRSPYPASAPFVRAQRPFQVLPLPPQQPPTLVRLPTRRGRILPLCLAEVPLQILGRALAAKGSKMHKDTAKERS